MTFQNQKQTYSNRVIIKEMNLARDERKPVEQVDEKLQQNWTSFVRRHICYYARAILRLIVHLQSKQSGNNRKFR